MPWLGSEGGAQQQLAAKFGPPPILDRSSAHGPVLALQFAAVALSLALVQPAFVMRHDGDEGGVSLRLVLLVAAASVLCTCHLHSRGCLHEGTFRKMVSF